MNAGGQDFDGLERKQVKLSYIQSGTMIYIRVEKAAQCLHSWIVISDRIIKARFYSRFIKTTVIKVYAPTNEVEEEEKDNFYE